MDTCASCGHELVVGRFCTNCGRLRESAPTDEGVEATRQLPAVSAPVAPFAGEPDDWRSDTAERPVARHAARPSALPPPPPPPPAPLVPGDGPRFPLYADQAAPVDAPIDAQVDALNDTAVDEQRHRPAPRRWLPWAAAATVLLLVVVLGVWMLAGGAPESPAQATDPASAGNGGHGAKASGGAADVAREATAQVPATAPPNQDVDGNMVRYESRNMLDGVPTTCWRMAGDGSGQQITFDLAATTTLTTVGLVNGYAKTATDGRGHELDWYHGNRRVLAVEWAFDDGTTVTQDLRDSRKMQTLDVDPVTTQHVRLTLVSVSPPGKGPAARDYTPISDVTLQGTAG
ncbi:hypothetical protein GCM10009844_26540 [Nocardioides koreensis]|uniref:NAD glycohydrolase translocation F5/8 type C domain-containing protein n=1 Tax=Nocardioides koreensis TaxID=433651 RepID=A0ABN2ZVA4_9ACTN